MTSAFREFSAPNTLGVLRAFSLHHGYRTPQHPLSWNQFRRQYKVRGTKNAQSDVVPTSLLLAPSVHRSWPLIIVMKYLQYLAAILAVAPSVLAAPQPPAPQDGNPYLAAQPYANKGYAAKLEETIKYFNAQKDHVNAAKTRTVQKIPTFAWVANSAGVSPVSEPLLPFFTHVTFGCSRLVVLRVSSARL